MENKKQQKTTAAKTPVPSQKRDRFLLKAALLSLVLHLLFSIFLVVESRRRKEYQEASDKKTIKIKLFDAALAKKQKEKTQQKSILETPLTPTVAPDKYDYLGEKDHKAKKETKLKKRVPTQDKALSAGNRNKEIQEQKEQAEQKEQKQSALNPKSDTLLEDGVLPKRSENKRPPRNGYEKLLSRSFEHLTQQYGGGHLEFIEGDMQDGDAIDLNTKEFRYISYFTGIRKAIELVWVYPLEAAQKGIQGKTQLKFTIKANGQVSHLMILQSSGHELLDLAIVNAIKLAAPFSPLPKGFGKDRLTITGSFTYVLTSYATSY